MDKKQIVKAVGKAGLNLIPGVGGSIASILEDYFTARKEERFEEFINGFLGDIERKNEVLIKEYVENIEFLDIFENILADVMKTRNSEKREFLKNLLVNSCITEGTSYDRTEEFQHLIDVVSITSIYVLKAFYDLQNIPMDNKKEHIYMIFNRIISNTQIEDENILLDYIGELESRSLIQSFRNNYYSVLSGAPLVSDSSYITEKGIEFCNFILSK